MQTKRTRPRQAQTYLQSAGNLARADESLGLYQKPKAKPQAPKLRLVENIAEEDPEADVLAQAQDFILGIGLSLTLCVLWFFTVLVLYRIVKLLIS
jgi:hypothetical protein